MSAEFPVQQHDEDGLMLCASCKNPILHGQFFVVVRQYNQEDVNSELAVHVGCERRIAGRNERRLHADAIIAKQMEKSRADGVPQAR